MPPADALGFCKEICRFQRPKSDAVNAKTKRVLSFTIKLFRGICGYPKCVPAALINVNLYLLHGNIVYHKRTF